MYAHTTYHLWEATRWMHTAFGAHAKSVSVQLFIACEQMVEGRTSIPLFILCNARQYTGYETLTGWRPWHASAHRWDPGNVDALKSLAGYLRDAGDETNADRLLVQAAQVARDPKFRNRNAVARLLQQGGV